MIQCPRKISCLRPAIVLVKVGKYGTNSSSLYYYEVICNFILAEYSILSRLNCNCNSQAVFRELVKIIIYYAKKGKIERESECKHHF